MILPDCLSPELRQQLEEDILAAAEKEALRQRPKGAEQMTPLQAAFWVGARFGAQFANWQNQPFNPQYDDEEVGYGPEEG